MPRRTVTSERTDVSHGFYRIIAGQREETAQANAYLGMRKIETCEASAVEEAVRDMTTVLDARMAELRRGREADVPTADEYAEAIAAIEIESRQRMLELLATHAKRPGSSATIADLARRLDTEEAEVAAAYARFGRKLAAMLEFKPDADGVDGTLAPLLALAEVTQASDDGRIQLRLRPEVRSAIDAMTKTA